MKHTITNQRDLRREFWNTFPNLSRKKVRMGKDRVYVCDTRVTWVDWIDGLSRDGTISQKLASRATLEG